MALGALQRCCSLERLVEVASPDDIIVVGAGTAGCTVISYLASHTDRPILVLEPGLYSHDDDESRFLDVLEQGLLSTSSDGYVQAKAIGGGSAINGMLLTGDEPEHLHGLTRMATADDIGPVGQSLIDQGGRFSRMWWNGGRWNPGRALRHLIEERRVTMLPRSATEVLNLNGRVVGVDCTDEPLSAATVVLCAGALATPAILLNSDIADLSNNIGMGLQNHPTLTATFSHQYAESFFDAAVVKEWTAEDKGLMLNIGYERVSASDVNHGMLTVSLMNPVSRGRVTVNAAGEPVADFGYLTDESDVRNMVHGVKDLLRLLKEGSFSSDTDSIRIEGAPLGLLESMSHENLGQWVKANVHGVSHASSSCADAVDSLGRVKGLENCWIADASVLPTVPSCTPAAPVTMEALRIARNIGESLS